MIMIKSEIEMLTERDLKQLRLDFVNAFGGDLLGVEANFTRGKKAILTSLYFEDAEVDYLMTDHECNIRHNHENRISEEKQLKVYDVWFRFIAGKVPEYLSKHDEYMLAKYDQEKFQI